MATCESVDDGLAFVDSVERKESVYAGGNAGDPPGDAVGLTVNERVAHAAAILMANLLVQPILPLPILGARRTEPPQQSYVVLYSIGRPVADRRAPEPWADRLLSLIRGDRRVQKGGLDVFLTRGSAEEFCKRFSQLMQNEGWTLEGYEMFPLGGGEQS